MLVGTYPPLMLLVFRAVLTSLRHAEKRKRIMETSARKFIIRLLLPLLVSLGVTHSIAQTPSPSPSPTPPRVALKAGRLLDVKTGRIATNVFIFVENHRITSVGPEAPAGVPVIDLSGAFVMPGMVDCHAHILGNLRDLSPGSIASDVFAEGSDLGHA